MSESTHAEVVATLARYLDYYAATHEETLIRLVAADDKVSHLLVFFWEGTSLRIDVRLQGTAPKDALGNEYQDEFTTIRDALLFSYDAEWNEITSAELSSKRDSITVDFFDEARAELFLRPAHYGIAYDESEYEYVMPGMVGAESYWIVDDDHIPGQPWDAKWAKKIGPASPEPYQ